jgi:flagellar FliL protein
MIRLLACLGLFLIAAAPAFAAEAEKPVERPDAQKEEENKHPGPPVVEFDDMIINLSEPSDKRTKSFLKLRMAIELTSTSDIPKVEAKKPILTDMFIVYMRELRVEDLQGSVGIIRLRGELLHQIAGIVSPIEVKNLLFKEILVQ